MDERTENTTGALFNITDTTNITFMCNYSCILPQYNNSSDNSTEARDIFQQINLVLIPICLITGILGNMITIILMNSKMFSKMASRYFLVALAASDISVLCTQPFKNMSIIRYIGTDVRSISEIGCKMYFWVHKTGKMTSSWIVVCLCLERLVAVKFPLNVKRWFSKRNSMLIILIIYIVIGAFNAGYSYCTKIDRKHICNPDVYDTTDPSEVLLHTHMLNVGTSLYFICPSLVLITATMVIIVTLVRTNNKRKQLTKDHTKINDITRPTAMLMSIVVAYIVFVTPVGILRTIALRNGINFFGTNMSPPFLTLKDIGHILELINYTINFFLYVCSSRHFRNGVISLFLKCKTKCICCLERDET